MNLLPRHESAVIQMEKLTNYALDFGKDPDKAEAFRRALGYTQRNAKQLADNVRENLHNFEVVFKGNNGFGDLYECVMRLTGANGREANVLTGWIVENGTDFPRLTTLYVTKRKGRG